jgi:hypothetical protein
VALYRGRQDLDIRLLARPVELVDKLACPDLFESDEELAKFLAMVYTDRRSGLARGRRR